MSINGLHITEMGLGKVTQDGDSFELTIPPTPDKVYHNAQISSYLTRKDFTYSPPLKMSIRATFNGDIQGTAGFGFWNHPYAPGQDLFSLRLPKALWFFYGSRSNNMALAKDVPGHGWKAATFDATGWRFLALLPFAPLGFLLMRIPVLYNALWPIGQRSIGVSEQLLGNKLMQEPHSYMLEWREDKVKFIVDGQIISQANLSPGCALGFIAWIDNQYAIVTPQGRFNAGVVDTLGHQSLIIEHLTIE